MERIVTNLVRLNQLKEQPYNKWLKYFNEDGVADVYNIFVKENEYHYEWLYNNSNIDLVRWQIQNNCFDWDRFSYILATYCPDLLDPKLFNWKKDEWAVVKYCPEKLKFSPVKYKCGRKITNYVSVNELKKELPHHWVYSCVNNIIDAHKMYLYNGFLAYEFFYKYSDIDLIGWQIENGLFDCVKNTYPLIIFAPQHFDPQKVDWEKDGFLISKCAPDLIDPDLFPWETSSNEVFIGCFPSVAIKYADRINWEKVIEGKTMKERLLILKEIRECLGLPKGKRDSTSIKFRNLLNLSKKRKNL